MPMQDKELTSQPLCIMTWWQLGHSLEGGNRVHVSQCQLLEENASEGKAAKAARLLFRPPAAPMQGKDLGPDQHGGALGSCGKIVLITYGEGSQDNCIQGTITEYSRAKWH